MKRKLLSLILAALLLASLLPTSVLPVSAATETINTVSVRATTPFAGQHPVFESKNYSSTTEDRTHNGYDIHTFTDAESGWKNGVMWLDRNGNVMTESDTFEAYQTYEVLVLVYAKNGYSFPKNPSTKVTAKVNDLAAKAASVGAGLKEGKDVIAVRYTFACRTSKTTIPKVAVEMDMSQIEDILVEGQELRYPEFTVTEGSEAKVEAIWYYRETEDDSWTQIYNIRIFEVKLGHYKLMLKPSIWDEHLHEIYQFPDSVPFYLNGVQTATLDYKDFYYGYAVIGIYTASAALPGDMDGDGDKDTDDAVYLLLNVMFGATDYPIANPDKDLNNDSKVNTDDAVYLLLHVMFGEEDYPI